jgi:glucose-1-phosphate adenylyltransferase
VLDKNVRVPAGARIGYDRAAEERMDRYHVTASGIVVVEGERSSVEVSTLFV